jgi:alpha-beta hydrolase superfamily lysophospholipase
MARRAATVAAILILACSCGGSPDDPADAVCLNPPVTFTNPVDVPDHREVTVHFTCEGARLAGTIYTPKTPGKHPAVVWLHGSGEQPRLSYGPLVAAYVEDGIVFFTYDKRGTGESEGNCCPDVDGHFNLVTADAEGAVAAARSYPGIDPDQVGFLGASAAGWIAPRAAEATSHVAFLAIASPGVLQHSLVAHYEEFAGGSESTDPRPSEAEIAKEIASFPREGFDPRPYLEDLKVPAIWLFGGADRNVPPVQSIAELKSIKKRLHKEWFIVEYPHAGHGLFDTPPTDARAAPRAEGWVRAHVHVPPVFGNEGPPLYGFYLRPEFGLIKKRALRFHNDAWFVSFPEPGSWNGVVEIAYGGHQKPLGHAYKYTANRRTLRLGSEVNRAGLKHSGFACGGGGAVYRWTRSENYTILRLSAIQDPCETRRRILEADWSFVD